MNENPENSVYDAVIAEATKPTYEELEEKVAYHTAETNRLQNLVEYYQNRLNEVNKLQRSRESDLETYLDENWEDLGDHAEPIADIFKIVTTKEVTVTLTVDFEVTLSVPRGEVDNVTEYDFDFEVNYSGEGDLDDSSTSITRFDTNEN